MEVISAQKNECSKLPASFRIFLVKDAAEDLEVVEACQLFNVPVSVTEDLQLSQSEDVLSIYVVNSFNGVESHGANYRILGRTALLEMAKKKKEVGDEYLPFSSITKPLFCHALSGQVICFTGFKKEDELLALKLLVHNMGGSVRKEMQSKVTHLIAKLCSGEKYFYAMTFRVPVVSETWVYDAWENRNIIGFNAADSEFISKYKLKPFHGSRICFLGYPEEEKNHMIEVLRENGGEPTDLADPMCTHLVTDKSLNHCRFLSMISYPNKRSIVLTPSSAKDDATESPTPRKKFKFNTENMENMDPNAQENRIATVSKTLTILGENGASRSVPKKKKSKSSEIFKSLNESNHKTETPLSVFVEKLPKKIEFEAGAEELIDFDTPPGIFDLSVIDPYLSVVNPDIQNMSRSQDESAIFNTVVDETKISAAPPLKSSKTFVVRAEWFWTSVQNEGRENEKKFTFDDTNARITPQSLNTTPLCASSSNRTRKRKRLKDKFSSFGSDLSPGQSAQKRRSSVSDVTRISEGSFLDYTASPDLVDDVESPAQEKSKKIDKRYKTFLELCETETNYVGILKTIMTLFKGALENMLDTETQLLNATELKIIFGHLPPIYTAHCGLLEELKQMANKWSDDADDLVKAYPPFINFFENTRDMLIKCDKTKPRFHAFLKVCQSKPECGRQSLQDLLIRPVQRLPSINLLLNDILRNTPKNSVDYKALEEAVIRLHGVVEHINEDKRKTEGQVALFDIFNEIENCPAHLVSSHRCFISRCEVTELSNNLSGRGNPLVLFLFSDVIEVCKKRKAFSNLKSPKENGGSISSKHGSIKLYKHVKLLPLNAILKVIDVKETEDCQRIFALRVKSCQESKEQKDKTYSFTITDESVEKISYLRMLCSQIANIVCRTDTDSYLLYLEAHQLDIDSSEVATGTLGKAFNKFATKTRIKVRRALSFNRTPNKLTPSTQLANLQLAALPNIPVSFNENVKN